MESKLFESTLGRFLVIVSVAVAAHLATVIVRGASRRLLLSRIRSEAKVQTVTGFATSVMVFTIYFGAFGFALSELGVSLTTYLASASVIGLAVSFGSQGVVQDVITGLTLVFSDLIDVGDMVGIGGEVGIVEHVGMRFTVLINFSGAHVFVPNRSITNVVNYPSGYVRAYMDVQLPADGGMRATAVLRVEEISRGAYAQYPGIMLLPPTVESQSAADSHAAYIRVKFRVWPGQSGILESAVKPAVAAAMRSFDPGYADWMVTVHHRSESATGNPARRLPRPSALQRHRLHKPAGRPDSGSSD